MLRRLLGNEWREVHRWLDALFKEYGQDHRCHRHHVEGIEEIRKMWGDEAAIAAKIHILVDCWGLPSRADYENGWVNEDYKAWRGQALNRERWVYIWADGVYSGLRAEDTKLCALVIIGVNERGEKRFLAIEDGVRESTQSWREILLQLKARGMNAPKLGIGDGAMGFWSALDEVYPATRHQRCWMHKTGNVLNCVPKAIQPKVKSALHEIWQAETRQVLPGPLIYLSTPMRRNIRKPLVHCKRIVKSSWHSMTSRQRTGKA